MRLIDAKQLEKQVKEAFETLNPVLMGQMLRWIRKQKTIDAVPVVRCWECKYSSYDEIFGNRWCNSHSGCRKVKDDGYCYLGEREECADNG